MTTWISNDLVNHAGMTFVFRAQEETGASPLEIVKAYSVVREVFCLDDYWDEISGLDNKLPTDVQSMLYLEGRRLMDRCTRWLVQARRASIDVGAEVEHFSADVRSLIPKVAELLIGAEHERLEMRAAEFTGLGVPDGLANRAAGLLDTFSLLDVVEIAIAEKLPADEVAAVYFAVSERIEVDRMLTRITLLPRDDRWTALARSALRYDLYAALAGLTSNVLTSSSSDADPHARIARLGGGQPRGRRPCPGDARRDHHVGHVRPGNAVRGAAHHPHPAQGLRTRATTSTARAASASVRSARAVSRSRETPSGTDGGRKHPTRTPASSAAAAASAAMAGSPDQHRHHGAVGGRGPQAGRQQVGRQPGRPLAHRLGQRGLGAQHAPGRPRRRRPPPVPAPCRR